MDQKEKNPGGLPSNFELWDFEVALDSWREADNKVNDIFEEWRLELVKIREGGGTEDEKRAAEELAKKYGPILEEAKRAADGAYNAFKEILRKEPDASKRELASDE